MKRTSTKRLLSYLKRALHGNPPRAPFNVGVLIAEDDHLNVEVGYAPFPPPYDEYLQQGLMRDDIRNRLDGKRGICNVLVGFIPSQSGSGIDVEITTEHLWGYKIIRCEVSYDPENNSLKMRPELLYEPSLRTLMNGRFRVPYKNMNVKKLPELEEYGRNVLGLAERIYLEGKKEVEMYEEIMALERDLLGLLER